MSVSIWQQCREGSFSSFHPLHVTHYTRTLYIVNCTLYIVHCTLYIVHCTLYIVHCTLYIVHCTFYIVHCTFYILHCTFYILHCTLYIVNFTLYIVHCTLYILHCTTSCVVQYNLTVHKVSNDLTWRRNRSCNLWTRPTYYYRADNRKVILTKDYPVTLF